MSKSSSDYKRKVDKLQKLIEETSGSVSKKEKCLPMIYIIGAVVPFIIGMVLFFLQPSFVQSKSGSEYVRDNKKVTMWTVGLSIGVLLMLFLYSYCSGYKNMTKICSK